MSEVICFDCEAVLNDKYKIATRESNGGFRIFSDVFNDIKNVYNTLNDEEERKELATALIGQRSSWIQNKLYEDLGGVMKILGVLIAIALVICMSSVVPICQYAWVLHKQRNTERKNDNKYWYFRKIYAEVCDLIEKENPDIKIDKTKNAETFVQNHLDD